MNDALLEEIRLAYQTQNLQPIRRCFFLHDDSGTFACPLVALAIHRGQVEIGGGANIALEAAMQAFGEDWTIGFLDGFDGREKAKNAPDYLRGYDLGATAAQQLPPRDPAV